MSFCCPVVHIDYPYSYPHPTLPSHYLTCGEKACCKPTETSPTNNPIHLLCNVGLWQGYCKQAKPQRHLPHTHITFYRVSLGQGTIFLLRVSLGEMLDFIYVDWDFDMQGFGKSHVGWGFDINPSSM